VAGFIVLSLLCALAPSVEVLVAARFAQGLTGGVGVVIASAAGRDLYTGGKLLRYYGRLTVLGGLAAIVGPVLGGQLAAITDWRGIFIFLSGVGTLILVAALLLIRETLPPALRVSGGMRQTRSDIRRLFADRLFVGAVLVTGFVNAALFAYLSGATFVLQDLYGLSPQGYSYAFGLNSAGYMIFGFLGARSSARWSIRGTLLVGLLMVAAGAAGLLVTAALHLPLPVVLASLFALVSGTAFTSPPATSLALADYPDAAGTTAAFLGVARFAFGGLAAPLVGLGHGVAPLAIVTATGAVLAAVSYAFTVRPRTTTRNDALPAADKPVAVLAA
jgi:DHA1 family bicyclomycin/chloramphenicol resistance-like MFS transporter